MKRLFWITQICPILSQVALKLAEGKTVLMNLFAGQEQRCRCTEQTVDTTGEEKKAGWIEGVALTYIH